MRSIACNLIYNDGGENPNVGFTERCTNENIKYNVENGAGRWCSQPECSCRKYYDRRFQGFVEEYPCNESHLFVDWQWNPGSHFITDKPFLIRDTGQNKIAILTTKFSFEGEHQRKIIGFLKISKIVNSHQIFSYKNQSVRLTLEDAKELDFWNYYKNPNSNSILWNQKRFRYLSDEQVAAMLHDMREIVQNDQQQAIITNILKNDFPSFNEERPNVIGALNEDIPQKVLVKRKYGKGGESILHKQLKEYIARNPALIGLSNVTSLIEHKFISGDLVDILFESNSSEVDTVVEIELNHVLPGIHQAIKYRALRCSQIGIPLNSKKVKAVVVAWEFSEQEIKLCLAYDIQYYQKKL